MQLFYIGAIIVLLGLIILTVIVANEYYYNTLIINDVTCMNPTLVSKVITPVIIGEIKAFLQNTHGPICVGGGRYSMGGQTSISKGNHIDMRKFNKVTHLDIERKRITVETGITWRDVQEAIDPYNLSVAIMQSYCNFTVGGSISVNAHGRWMRQGCLANSIISLRLILADGSEILASREENSDIFFGSIGGYGGLGLIVEATLLLEDNERMMKIVHEVEAQEYERYFHSLPSDTILHNGDLYYPECSRIRVESWVRTSLPVTVQHRLIPRSPRYWLQPNLISLMSILPFGQKIRAYINPYLDNEKVVVWRNYESSHDVAELEPITPRWIWTYALQEYFIPVSRFIEFIDLMKAILHRYSVNVINISIRHSPADNQTILTWAPQEVYSFVLYYKQGTKDQEIVGKWTRELIDAAITLEGTYYLPYQIHATREQFIRSYPGYTKFLELKRKYDPTNKFNNNLLQTYQV